MIGDLKGRTLPGSMLGCLRRRTGRDFGDSLVMVGTGDRGGGDDDDGALARVMALMAGAAYLGFRNGGDDGDELTALALVSL